MRRIAVVWVGACLLVSMFAFSPGATAVAAPAGIAAGYRLHVDTGSGYTREDMTLLENQTGYTDLDSIAWSRKNGQITLVFSNRLHGTYEATYVGSIVPTGISTRRQPGTITGVDGEAGVFYAVNKTK
jgi:hypothetical protein